MSASSCPFKPSTDAKYSEPDIEGTAAEKLAHIWNQVLERQCSVNVVNPSLNEVLTDVTTTDYNELFINSNDTRDGQKLLCANGALCKVRIEWLNHHYTGLFDKSDYGLMRLSSALKTAGSDRGSGSGSSAGAKPKPKQTSIFSLNTVVGSVADASLFPCVGLKFLRTGAASGNLLFGGKKTGQSETDFFAHAVCTHLTEKISFVLSWILGVFRQYSSFPLQLGLSAFAQRGEDGSELSATDLKFPWCISLAPTAAAKATAGGGTTASAPTEASGSTDAHALYMQQLLSIAEGTHIYDIFAIRTPMSITGENGGIELIGRLVTASPMVCSEYGKKVFFQHQLKEEDYELRPHWRGSLKAAHGEVGGSYFERSINQGKFRQAASRKNTAACDNATITTTTTVQGVTVNDYTEQSSSGACPSGAIGENCVDVSCPFAETSREYMMEM